jgi:hypothetical protein
MALEEDEYKRDDFITLAIKSKLSQDFERKSSLSDDNSTNSKSSAKLQRKKLSKTLKIKRDLHLK